MFTLKNVSNCLQLFNSVFIIMYFKQKVPPVQNQVLRNEWVLTVFILNLNWKFGMRYTAINNLAILIVVYVRVRVYVFFF